MNEIEIAYWWLVSARKVYEKAIDRVGLRWGRSEDMRRLLYAFDDYVAARELFEEVTCGE